MEPDPLEMTVREHNLAEGFVPPLLLCFSQRTSKNDEIWHKPLWLVPSVVNGSSGTRSCTKSSCGSKERVRRPSAWARVDFTQEASSRRPIKESHEIPPSFEAIPSSHSHRS